MKQSPEKDPEDGTQLDAFDDIDLGKIAAEAKETCPECGRILDGNDCPDTTCSESPYFEDFEDDDDEEIEELDDDEEIEGLD